MRFGKKEKLSPRYVEPYQIVRHFDNVDYKLDFPSNLALVHPVFHESLLKKCIGDLASIVTLESISVNERISYNEVPVEILERQVRKLKNKEVTSVKVLWRNKLGGVLLEKSKQNDVQVSPSFPFGSFSA
ncbi:hypothetical protein MTR67_018703 [Solanum verrucosum]|uniref:Tf2-1-like SH3-like domain-containing protein n=1 Tax=Solanum verrucosum TaxID=315347 RepID=A0AAF0QLH2_SOLVR|nr:hypothetical protein MTR67_018703 [Solanum verrucosum]